jgi:hypothetical protein
MGSLLDLGTVKLTIPAWQMALYVGIVAFYMIWGRIKCCFVATYAFALYLGYYVFAAEFLRVTRGNPSAESAYFAFGIALVAFNLIAIFYEEH